MFCTLISWIELEVFDVFQTGIPLYQFPNPQKITKIPEQLTSDLILKKHGALGSSATILLCQRLLRTKSIFRSLWWNFMLNSGAYSQPSLASFWIRSWNKTYQWGKKKKKKKIETLI